MPFHRFERTNVHEQQKARLDVQEAKLNGAERNARARQLIEAARLI
jgi:hypothetical protein